MINLLISTNKLDIIKKLTNSITNYENVRIAKIATNEYELFDILENNNIDLVFLDIAVFDTKIKDFLGFISQKKDIYKNSIILYTDERTKVSQFIDTGIIKDYILKNYREDKIVEKINYLIKNRDLFLKRKEIINELTSIKYNIQYKGTNYLIDTILHMYMNKELMFCDLQNSVYPIIARKHKKTVNTIRCNIRHSTTCMYCDCDIEILKKYFGLLDDDPPTVKEVIYTVLEKIS